MRTVLNSLLIMLVLVTSVEGTIDRASAGHPHGEETTHELADSDPHDHARSSELSDDEAAESHCEHCCHGHSSSITSSSPEKSIDPLRSCVVVGYNDSFKALSLEPPTPPPTV